MHLTFKYRDFSTAIDLCLKRRTRNTRLVPRVSSIPLESSKKSPSKPCHPPSSTRSTIMSCKSNSSMIGDDPVSVFEAKVFLQRGCAYFGQGKTELAIADLGNSIARNACVESLCTRALLYREAGQPNEAIQDYTRALELDPKNVSTYLSRSELYRAIPKVASQKDAYDDIKRALKIDPKNAEANFYAAKICELFGKSEMAKAHMSVVTKLGGFKPREIPSSSELERS